jgi:uncharacterized protein with von Willebrand factor type A (vWA) domain
VERVLEWLQNPVMPRELSAEERARMKELDLDELARRFREMLDQQKERHDGGKKYIGTGGTSPFGNGGQNPAGIRVGGGGGQRTAVKVAMRRNFRNLRDDHVLDVRQIGVALRMLRRLSREGAHEELDLDGTIAQAGKNAGEIDLVFRRPRKNAVKLVLMMDVGGSMDDHVRVCELLFSAARAAKHFKEFRPYYFHNCPYEQLYADMYLRKGPKTADLLRDLDPSWCLMIVGDAAMAPTELLQAGGSIDWYRPNSEAGIVWLQRLARRFPRAVWMNPNPPDGWWSATARRIKQLFPMYPLTVGGLRDAVTKLRGARAG